MEIITTNKTANCMGCGEQINKGERRVKIENKKGYYASYGLYHLKCYHKELIGQGKAINQFLKYIMGEMKK